MKRLYNTLIAFFVLLATVNLGYSACEGDINCSGVVDGSDLATLAADFGTTGCGSCDDVIGRLAELEGKVAFLGQLLEHFTRNGDDIFIEGANLHIQNGTDSTSGTPNGLGNLIVGYDEARTSDSEKTGSHNIVVGREHNYSAYGGLAAGYHNTISGAYASVSGGQHNTASGDYASISGGFLNEASSGGASVSGGLNNTANALTSSISGGNGNTAGELYSSVSGGAGNTASGLYSSVAGGLDNTATGGYASISGGRARKRTRIRRSTWATTARAARAAR